MGSLTSFTGGTAIAASCPGVASFSANPHSKQYIYQIFNSARFGATSAVSCNDHTICCRRLVTRAFSKSPPKDGGSFFESSIVQTELTRIHSDYKELFHLGRKYPLFDREGKLSYIREMQDVLERWQIFHKRMELSDDSTVKLYAKHLKTKVNSHEESDFEMVVAFYKALENMKREVEAGL